MQDKKGTWERAGSTRKSYDFRKAWGYLTGCLVVHSEALTAPGWCCWVRKAQKELSSSLDMCQGGQSPRSRPLPAAYAHTECSWPWHLDPAIAHCQPHLQQVVLGPRAGVVAVQRQWACVVVELDRVHGGNQVAATALLEGGAPTEELEACAPAPAGGR